MEINILKVMADIYSKIPKNAKIIFIGVSGSTSYGLSTPTSDIDIKSVYLQTNEDILSNNYVPQVNINNDHASFELRRFLELVENGNPNASEMLWLNDEHILFKTNEFDTLLELREKFLSKNAYNVYVNYATSQIKKATSLNKKYNYTEADKKKPHIIDFAKVVSKRGKSYNLVDWLKENEYKSEYIGLSKLEGHRDQYMMYIDDIKFATENVRFKHVVETRNYKGFGDGNEPLTSEIENYCKDLWKGIVYWNREAYSSQCKKYKEYLEWETKKNVHREATNLEHGQKFDSKNIMHLYRLILVAESIVLENRLKVDMSDQREFLLDIKNGKKNLKQMIEISEDKMKELKEVFERSNLPDHIDKNFISSIELALRGVDNRKFKN